MPPRPLTAGSAQPLPASPAPWLIAVLARVVEALAHDSLVEAFYIGRASNPYRRAARHHCTSLLPILYVNTAGNAARMEADLLELIGEHPKCRNVALHGGGGARRGAPTVLYVALWSACSARNRGSRR